MKAKQKYTFDEFFFDFMCLWPAMFLAALIIGNVIKHGL